VASNVAGERQSRPATVLVLRRPHFLVKPNNITALIGQNIEFHCQVSREIVLKHVVINDFLLVITPTHLMDFKIFIQYVHVVLNIVPGVPRIGCFSDVVSR
jgi:hypothetical protein